MTDLPAEYDAERKPHVPGKGALAVARHEMSTIHRLGSAQILKALADEGKDATWFAKQLSSLMGLGDKRVTTRAMELVAKLIAQKEGSKLQVGDLRDKTDEELQEAYAELLDDLKEKGILRESG
jgi:O-acetyl-ADP-ribose deacetylase (regulator of RNase III)